MEPGTRFGRYVVEELVGHGGMADVYRVRDEDSRAWALKVLTLVKTEVRERFVAEARIQLSLDHPHLVRAREVVEAEGETGLVMEYVPGSSLDRWLVANEPPIEVRDRLALQVLDAVGHAHRLGLVHRDLKPANVLVLETDEGPIAKVTDFGLAKQLGVAATRTGVALGTPRYMAPEQIRDAKRVDARADVWSLGALLYELYLGEPAFHRETLMEVFAAVLEGTYPDPADRGAPERVAAAIRACLVVDPGGRAASTEEIADRLRGEAPVPTPPPPIDPSPPHPAPAAPTIVADEPAPAPAAPRPTATGPARAGGVPLGRLVAPWIGAWAVALGIVVLLFLAGVTAIGAWTWGQTASPEPPPHPSPELTRPERRPRRPVRRP